MTSTGHRSEEGLTHLARPRERGRVVRLFAELLPAEVVWSGFGGKRSGRFRAAYAVTGPSFIQSATAVRHPIFSISGAAKIARDLPLAPSTEIRSLVKLRS